mgnify:CR=1 FL=1|jgi:GNAT superfamily N-acetyltransferase
MKPSINKADTLIPDYYDFSEIDIDNIRNKIEIVECGNIGISYGQFFACMNHETNEDFDYHLWIEDDYIICTDYFEKILTSIYQSTLDYENTHICPFIYKNKKWNILPYARQIEETDANINILKRKLSEYGAQDLECHIPDMMQLGIFSRGVVQKIKSRFGSFEKVIDFFNVPLTKIWLHQILFGYVLHLSNVKLQDTAETMMNIFYETSIDKIFLCNYPENVNTWKERQHNNDLLCLPLCIPIDTLIYPEKFKDDLSLIKKYLSTSECFDKVYNKYVSVVSRQLENLNQDLVLRQLRSTDYHKGYDKLMHEFTQFNYSVSKDDFSKYLETATDNVKIYVVYSKSEKAIVGAGSIFCLHKLHNHPVGQIEDFIVTEHFRKRGIGRLILDKLIDVGLHEMNCYKIVLKTNKDNFVYYTNIGFEPVGVEMKYVK